MRASTGLSPAAARFPKTVPLGMHVRLCRSFNPAKAVTSAVWAFPRSLAATEGITVVFSSSGYLDVSVLRVCLPCGISRLQREGLPHSEIRGSIRMCRSPRLIAAYRVLPRLREPRHPPYALRNFLQGCRGAALTRRALVLDVSMFSFSHYVNERASNFSHFPFSLRRYAKGAGRMIRPRGFESLGSFSKSLTKRLSVRCRSLGMVWWR